MPTTASEAAKEKSSQKVKIWRCWVCGFIYRGESPPKECPQCSSSYREFSELLEKTKLKYDGAKFDVLLINGSSHRANNTGTLADFAEEELKRKGATYRRYNLNELNINHCWCCYTIRDSACTYPCRDQLDDMAALHEMLINARAVIVASPINWNNMTARLKDFLDRLTSIQNVYLLKKKGYVQGKVVGILITGHEDGAAKTAMEIFLYFEQLGYILAPFGFSYKTHGAQFNTNTDYEYFKNDQLTREKAQGVVSNVVEMMRLEPEEKLKGKLVPVAE